MRKSSLATAGLFEEFRLPAVFAVIAEPKDFALNFVKGDFAMWNELQSRGHLVQPHGYTHAKLTDLPHERAIGELEMCLAAFGEKLDGFDAKRAVYCYAYNCGNDRMNGWLRPRVRATRQTGSGFLSQRELDAGAWNCETFGPGDPAGELNGLLDRAKRERPAGFLFTLHGVDGEAWGAIALDGLRRVLERIVSDEAFEYWAVGR